MFHLTEQQKKLIFDLVIVPGSNSSKITDEEFLLNFPVSADQKQHLCLQILETAYHEKNAEEVEYGLIVGFHFGFTLTDLDILHQLVEADWHFKHEDIITALDQLRSPQSVDVIYRTAIRQFNYLEYDESYALGVKCIWALRHIGTLEVVERLQQLAQSDNSIFQEKATKRLRELEQQSPAEEVRNAAHSALVK